MVFVLMTALSVARVAAQSEPPAPDDRADERPEQIEEITVIGTQTTRTLRLEVQAARERVYDLFNSLNDDRELEILCRDAPATGTRVPQRVCRPRFADTATANAATVLLRALLFECSGSDFETCFNRNLSRAQGEVAGLPSRDKQLATEVQRLARENREFRRAISEYQVAENRYRDAQRAEGPGLRASVSIIDTVPVSRPARSTPRQNGLVAPRPLQLVTPDAPPVAGRAARESWLKLRYSVRTDGATGGVRVVDTLPPGFDASSAIAAAETWTFEPATADGVPIEWHNNLAVVVFSGEVASHEGWLDLAEAYEETAAFIAAARFEDAKSRNEYMLHNLALTLEDAGLVQMQLAAIEHAMGDPHAALAAIRRATEPAVPQLAAAELGLALEHRFALEVELGRVADALETFERRTALARRRSSSDPIARRAGTLRQALAAPDANLAARGRIDSNGRWEHALSWSTFAVGDVEGRTDGLELECHRRKTELPFEVDAEITIPATWGRCALIVVGRPNATFTLYEFRDPSG
jgi:tetratricopeptide (TPR) repeat protein